jgi:hypothetical protein
MAARLGHGGGSSKLGIAHAMGHCFRRGLTLRMQCLQGNSPRGPRMVGVTGVGRVIPVGLLQPLATSRTSYNGRPVMRLGYAGVVRHIEG